MRKQARTAIARGDAKRIAQELCKAPDEMTRIKKRYAQFQEMAAYAEGRSAISFSLKCRLQTTVGTVRSARCGALLACACSDQSR
jgi:hypothetical protein